MLLMRVSSPFFSHHHHYHHHQPNNFVLLNSNAHTYLTALYSNEERGYYSIHEQIVWRVNTNIKFLFNKNGKWEVSKYVASANVIPLSLF